MSRNLLAMTYDGSKSVDGTEICTKVFLTVKGGILSIKKSVPVRFAERPKRVMPFRKHLYLVQIDIWNADEPSFRLVVLSQPEHVRLKAELEKMQADPATKLKGSRIFPVPGMFDHVDNLLQEIQGEALRQNPPCTVCSMPGSPAK